MSKLKTLAAAAILTAAAFTAATPAMAASLSHTAPPALPALEMIFVSFNDPATSTSASGQASIAHHRHRGFWKRRFYWWCYRRNFEPKSCWIFS